MSNPLYHTRKWKAKRDKILKRDGYMCQLSLRYGKRIDADTVHHIYPLEDYPQYAYCDWNLISVSNKMHNMLHDRNTNKLTELGEILRNKTIPPHLE